MKKIRRIRKYFIPAFNSEEEFVQTLPDHELKVLTHYAVSYFRNRVEWRDVFVNPVIYIWCGRICNLSFLQSLISEYSYRFKEDHAHKAYVDQLVYSTYKKRIPPQYHLSNYTAHPTWLSELRNLAVSQACNDYTDKVYFKRLCKNPVWTNREKPTWWDEVITEYHQLRQYVQNTWSTSVLRAIPVQHSISFVYNGGVDHCTVLEGKQSFMKINTFSISELSRLYQDSSPTTASTYNPFGEITSSQILQYQRIFLSRDIDSRYFNQTPSFLRFSPTI